MLTKKYVDLKYLLFGIGLAIIFGYLVPVMGIQAFLLMLIGAICVIAGFAIVACVALKPNLFWPTLIVGSVVSTGLMPFGFTIVDEYIIGCIIFGSFAASSLAIMKYQSRRINNLQKLHYIIFFLLIAYMLFQCFRGILVLDSPRKIRWVIFYLMLGMLVPLLSGRRYPIPSVRKIAFLVTIASLVYFSVYLGYGLIFELLGVNRFHLQYAMKLIGVIAIWGSTAYTMFPLVVAIPAILIIVKDRSRVYRWIGWITLLILTCTAFYYDSRVSIFTITVFMFVSLFSLGLRKWFIMIAVCVLSLFLFFSFIWKDSRNLSFFLNDTYGTINRLQEAESSGIGKQDIYRYVWMKAGFLGISDNCQHFLFGHGFRTSGRIVAPYVHNLLAKYGRPMPSRDESVATEAITNLLVDTGVIGIFFLIINFILVALQILERKGNSNRIILILSLFVIFAWLFVINIVDVMLFYLMIMPSGFLVQLSRYNSTQNLEKLSKL